MQRIPVDSSTMVSVGYDADSGILEIEFVNGRLYRSLRDAPTRAIVFSVIQLVTRLSCLGGRPSIPCCCGDVQVHSPLTGTAARRSPNGSVSAPVCRTAPALKRGPSLSRR